MVMSIVGTALAGIIFAVCASAAAVVTKGIDQNPDFKKQLEEGLNKGLQKGLDEADK